MLLSGKLQCIAKSFHKPYIIIHHGIKCFIASSTLRFPSNFWIPYFFLATLYLAVVNEDEKKIIDEIADKKQNARKVSLASQASRWGITPVAFGGGQ